MKISILVPTLNNVEYLKIVIPAFRKYTGSPHEILVYANKYSPEMKEYASKEHFDVFEYSHENEGVAMPTNLLAKRATGDIIFYVGDDVYVTPGWDEMLIRKFNDDIFYQYLTACLFEPRWKNPVMNTPFNFGRTPETWQEERFLFEWWDLRQITEDLVSGSGPVFVKKTLWDSVGGFDEAYWPGFGTDPDLIAKIYFTAVKEEKPYEFRGVSDCGMYHFQSIGNEKVPDDKRYRLEAHRRFERKWRLTAKELARKINWGAKL